MDFKTRIIEKSPMILAGKKRFSQKFDFKIHTDDISLLRFFANSNDGVDIVPEIGVKEDLEMGNIEKV